MKSKLQFLSKLFCNRDIQPANKGHDPNEDALSTMELVLLKLKNGLDYGDRLRNSVGGWNGPSREKILGVISSAIVSIVVSKSKSCFLCYTIIISLFLEVRW